MGLSIAALITSTEKNKKHLEQLVSSLCQQSILVEKIIIIYDGALRPEKKTFEDCPLPISWIDNTKGQSLTYLQNQAIQFTKENFVLLLNDDVILDKHFIENLLGPIKKNKDIGMVCGKILRMDKAIIDTAGQLLRNNRTPLERGYGKEDKGEFDKPEFVFGSCGAAVLYRRKMLEDCALSAFEYFDNDYNMFYEDMDISWRAANLNWKAYYVPKAVAYHMRGATAKEKKPVLKFIRQYNFAWLRTELKTDLIKNRYMTIIKNDRLKDFLFYLPQILIYELKVFLYCLIFDPKVLFDTFKNLPVILKAFKKRKALRKKIKKKK